MSLTASEEDAEVTREEHAALKWAALAATLIIGWLILPIGVGMLLGIMLAFLALPLYGRVKTKVGGAWASLLVVLGTGSGPDERDEIATKASPALRRHDRGHEASCARAR